MLTLKDEAICSIMGPDIVFLAKLSLCEKCKSDVAQLAWKLARRWIYLVRYYGDGWSDGDDD